MNALSRRITLMALATVVAASFPSPSQAQVPDDAPPPVVASPQPPRLSMLSLLESLEYDTDKYVPLMVVNPGRTTPRDAVLPHRLTSPSVIADAAGLRIISAGKVDAIVPRTLPHINARPEPVDPFAQIDRSTAFRIVLGTLSEDQWRLIGSETGLGLDDLDADQRVLWSQVMPASLSITKQTFPPQGNAPGVRATTSPVALSPDEVARLHIRINKRTVIGLARIGSNIYDGYHDFVPNSLNIEGSVYRAEPPMQFSVPDYRRRMIGEFSVRGPNDAKPGDVHFSAESLDPRISLAFDPRSTKLPDGDVRQLPTIGDVLDRINTATSLHFVADRRVRYLPVYFRGRAARSGDLLQALARSVGGTFRKIPPSKVTEPTLYLLTFDVEGIGAQAARFQRWMELMVKAKDKVDADGAAKAARRNAFSHLSFAPDDPYALTPEQMREVEPQLRKDRNDLGAPVAFETLPPAMRTTLRNLSLHPMDAERKYRIDHVELSERLDVSVIVPGIGALPQWDLSGGLGRDYLRAIMEATTQTTSQITIPEGFPTGVKRGVVIAAPSSADDAWKLIAAASARGVKELWLQVRLGDPAAIEILREGIRAGRLAHIAVGASVSLLRQNGIVGEEFDRNILGEAGKALTDDLTPIRESIIEPSPLLEPVRRPFRSEQYDGWSTADLDEIAPRVAAITAIPGLHSLAFRATVAPGWTGTSDGGSVTDYGVPTRGELGYSLSTRRAFLSEFGVDPIDIRGQLQAFNFAPVYLGYFIEDDGASGYRLIDAIQPGKESSIQSEPFLEFLDYRNKTLLAQLYRTVRKSNPNVALYIDDRASPIIDVPLPYFGSWDAPDRLPQYAFDRISMFPNQANVVDSEKVVSSARASSKTILGLWQPNWVPPTRYRDELPNWNGTVMDFSSLKTSDVIHRLAAWPTLPSRP